MVISQARLIYIAIFFPMMYAINIISYSDLIGICFFQSCKRWLVFDFNGTPNIFIWWLSGTNVMLSISDACWYHGLAFWTTLSKQINCPFICWKTLIKVVCWTYMHVSRLLYLKISAMADANAHGNVLERRAYINYIIYIL